jgi:hypothetical protein
VKASSDIVEVFDGSRRVIEPLKDINGGLVKIASLTNLKFSCSVVLEEKNTIFVTGGFLFGMYGTPLIAYISY